MSAVLGFVAWMLHAWDTLRSKTRNIVERGYQVLLRSAYRLERGTPRHAGYGAYRQGQILSAIRNKTVASERLPAGFGKGLDERIVEYPWLFSRLSDRPGRLLDAGSVLNNDDLLRRPELTSKRVFISTLAPESTCSWWRNISYTYEDLRNACFRDGYFDWVVCLSTLEHVGMETSAYTRAHTQQEAFGDSVDFLRELHRVLKPGGTLYLSFPFGRAAAHGWVRVIDSVELEKIVARFKPRVEARSFFRCGSDGWKACSAEAAADARYFLREDTDNPLGIAAAEAVACLELVK